ncbi:hypothetical protein AB0B79_14380 [Streptomyces sp. NPDC039022]|uniref:hypothetical protein n=1 Tax=unclassified Streptomyces TaxID=2593676 RepID=UPI0033FB72D8
MSGTDAPVHQIVFRWDADLAVGGAGVGPVAWSGNRDGLGPIYRKVATLLSVPGDGARESLARVELRGERGAESSVLLIRRIPGQDHGGRPTTCSHALLGSPSVLTPGRCLGLHSWRWEGSGIDLLEAEGRSLECVPAQALRAATERAAPELTERARLFDAELTTVLAGRLREPRQRLSVRDHTGGDGPVHVLWALWNLTGRALPGWSFATHDTRDGGPFRYVFVPRWPVSATQDQQLTRLDPARPDHGDPAGEAAAGLAEHYMEIRHDPGALRETRRALAELHVFEKERLDERVRLVHEALKWLSHAGDHRRTRTGRTAEPREPLYDRAREEQRYDSAAYGGQPYDATVFDNMRQDQDQERPTRRRTPDQGRDQDWDRDRGQDRDQGQDRDRGRGRDRGQDRGHDRDHDRQAYERSRDGGDGRSYDRPASPAVRADAGLARGVSAQVLDDVLRRDGTEAGEYLANSADRVLLEVLGGGLPAQQADRVARVLILRAPHRSAADAHELGERLLRARLFLGPHGDRRAEYPVTGPADQGRVHTAVRLYDGLVRPYGDQGQIPALLRQVLPDLWNGDQGLGREALGHLLDDGRPTGFGEQGWRALFGAATHTVPETTAASSVREEPRRGVRGFAGRSAGRGLRSWVPRSRGGRAPGGARDPDPDRDEAPAGRIWVGALLMVVAVAVIMIAVIALTGS